MIKTELVVEPFHNQPKDDSVLYRYVTIDKLLDFLFCGRIPLVRLSVFEDKLEGVHVNNLLLNYTSDRIGKGTTKWLGELFKHVTLNINSTKRNSLRRQKEIFQDSNFASCWYINDYESVAMWQLYSNSDSVAIRIPFKDLSDELVNLNFNFPIGNYEALRFGCIDYIKFNDLKELSGILIKEGTQGFVKDLSFQHEQEFRILVKIKPTNKGNVYRKPMILDEQVENLNTRLDIKAIYMNLKNFKSLPFEIIFHPKSYYWHRENIIKILNKFELPFKTSESVLTDIFT